MMMGYGIWTLASSLLSAVFGGGMMYFFTIRSKKKEAAAQAQNAEAIAEGSELNNVEKAIRIWREMAENLKAELQDQRCKSNDMSIQIEKLSKEIARLTRTNNRIIELLNKMNHENFNELVQKITEELQKD